MHNSELDISKVIKRCEDCLDWDGIDSLVARYHQYKSLPVIVIDAVFSINAKYEQVVRLVVKRYCEKILGCMPNDAVQTVEEFLDMAKPLGSEGLAGILNYQRTSTRNGILKSDAVIQFCEVLHDFGVNNIGDKDRIANNDQFCRMIRMIPGQALSLDYFLMMIGREDVVKADRRILGFLQECLGRPVNGPYAAKLLTEASKRLSREGRIVRPCYLDNLIWNYQGATR